MYGRLKMYSEKTADDKNWVPGPYHQIKDRHFYGMVGMSDRNFGFGEKIDLSKPANENPEAIYEIPGFCETTFFFDHYQISLKSSSNYAFNR